MALVAPTLAVAGTLTTTVMGREFPGEMATVRVMGKDASHVPPLGVLLLRLRSKTTAVLALLGASWFAR